MYSFPNYLDKNIGRKKGLEKNISQNFEKHRPTSRVGSHKAAEMARGVYLYSTWRFGTLSHEGHAQLMSCWDCRTTSTATCQHSQAPTSAVTNYNFMLHLHIVVSQIFWTSMDLFFSSQSPFLYFEDWKMVTTIEILACQSTGLPNTP
jgi:hypothetical protein